jgi:hypothetical protein
MELWQLDTSVDFSQRSAAKPVFERTPGQFGSITLQYVDDAGKPIGASALLARSLPESIYPVRDMKTGDRRDLVTGMDYQGLHGVTLGYFIGSVVSPRAGVIKEVVRLAEGDGSTGYGASVLLKDRIVVVWSTGNNRAAEAPAPGTPIEIRMRAYDFDLNPIAPARTLFAKPNLRSPFRLTATDVGFAMVWRDVDGREQETLAKSFSATGDELWTAPAFDRPAPNRFATQLKDVVAYHDGSLCVRTVAKPYGKEEWEAVYLDPRGRATGRDWICRWRDHLALRDTEDDTDMRAVDASWVKAFLSTPPLTAQQEILAWAPGRTQLSTYATGAKVPSFVSTDQRWFVALTAQTKQFEIWNLTQPDHRTVVVLDNRLYDDGSVQITADNRYCLAVAGHMPLRIYSLDGGHRVGEVPLVASGYPSHVAISANKRIIVHDGRYLSRVDLTEHGYRLMADALLLHNNTRLLQVSPDGRDVLRVDHLGNIERYRFIPHPDLDWIGVYRLASIPSAIRAQAVTAVWSAPDKDIAIVWNDGTIIRYDADTLVEKYRLSTGPGRVLRANASANGRYLGLTTRVGDAPQGYNRLTTIDLVTRTMTTLMDKMPRFATAFPAVDGKSFFLFSLDKAEVKPVTRQPETIAQQRPATAVVPVDAADDIACRNWLDDYTDKLRKDEEVAQKYSSLVQLRRAGPNSQQIEKLRKVMPDCRLKRTLQEIEESRR